MERDDFEAYLRDQCQPTEADWVRMRAWMQTCAKHARLYYDALVTEGFTPQQAIHLIMAHGVMPKFPPEDGGGSRDED